METINIIIADDHQIVLDGIQSFLEKEKEIEVAAVFKDGAEVIDYLRDHTADVAVLDIRMPQMDGLDTARYILKNHPKIKILLLTMHDDSKFILQAMRLGIHGYVLKDKSKEALVGAIHCVYRGSKYYSLDLQDKLVDPSLLNDDKPEQVRLTDREIEVLTLTGEALSAKEIASRLDITENTVNVHWRNLREKLKLTNDKALVRYAIKNGYTEL